MVINVLNFFVVGQAEAIIVAIVQLSLEFAVCYLERSELNSEDCIQVSSSSFHMI